MCVKRWRIGRRPGGGANGGRSADPTRRLRCRQIDHRRGQLVADRRRLPATRYSDSCHGDIVDKHTP